MSKLQKIEQRKTRSLFKFARIYGEDFEIADV